MPRFQSSIYVVLCALFINTLLMDSPSVQSISENTTTSPANDSEANPSVTSSNAKVSSESQAKALRCSIQRPVVCTGTNFNPTCCPANPNGPSSCCSSTPNGCLCLDDSCPKDGICCPNKTVRCVGADITSYCCTRRIGTGPSTRNCCGSVNGCVCPNTNVCPVDKQGTCCPRNEPVGCRGFDGKTFCCARDKNNRNGVCCSAGRSCACRDTNVCPVGETGFCCTKDKPILCTFFPQPGLRKLACCPKAVFGSDRNDVCCINSCAVIAGVCVGLGRRLGEANGQSAERTIPAFVPTEIPQAPDAFDMMMTSFSTDDADREGQ